SGLCGSGAAIEHSLDFDPLYPLNRYNQGTGGNGGNEDLTIESGSTVIMRTTSGPISEININTANGDDTITIESSVSTNGGGDFRPGNGNDVLLAEGDFTRGISGQSDPNNEFVEQGGGMDTVTVNGEVTGDVNTRDDIDIVTIGSDGTVGGNITTDGDTVTVNGTVTGGISTGGGNDMVTLNQGASVGATIDGDVDSKGGTITIQGETFTWANFDTLENNMSVIPSQLANDFNNDGRITPSDAIFVINRIGESPTGVYEPVDVDGDDDIDRDDAEIVLAQIGQMAAP
ncbi:MAG: polymer-forming cytoskeletal protein, partial [Chloroflexota bacterium]